MSQPLNPRQQKSFLYLDADVRESLRKIKPDVDFAGAESCIPQVLTQVRINATIGTLNYDECAMLLTIACFADKTGRADLTDDQIMFAFPIAKLLLERHLGWKQGMRRMPRGV